MPEQLTKPELQWRLWHLGEGDYKKYGRRNMAHRSKTGAPDRIPQEWWQRFEEFLARRGEDKEPPATDPVYPAGGLVSEHFAVWEFDCHDGQKVPAPAIPALVRLADVFLEPLRAEFGSVFVTSGYRPEAYNRRIGGAPQSCHIYDDRPATPAADLIPKHGAPSEWARFLRRIADQARVGGVGRYATFVHADLSTRRDW